MLLLTTVLASGCYKPGHDRPPFLVLDDPSVTLAGAQAGVQNPSDAPLQFHASEPATMRWNVTIAYTTGAPGWLTLTPTSGSTTPLIPNQTIVLSADPLGMSLPAGTYAATVTITSGWSSITASVLMVVAPHGGLANSAWPIRGYNERHTGQSPYNGPQTSHLAWTFSMSWGFGYWAPVVDANGTLYTGDWTASLYAINPDGTLKWTYASQTQDVRTLSPCIGWDGTIYCRGSSDRLVALRPENGTEIWGLTIGKTDKLNPSPNIASDGTIYAGTLGGNLYAVNPDGSIKWTFSTGGEEIASSPSIAPDGTILFGTGGTGVSLFAVNPSGTLKWKYVTGGRVRGAPAIAEDGTIYCISQDSYLYAVSPDGSLKWSYLTGGCEVGPSIASDGTVVAGVGGSGLGTFATRGYAAFSPDGPFGGTIPSAATF
jgi:outer membrane protein assembly factor BamB